MKNKNIDMENDQELERLRKKKLRRRLKARRFWDRLAGFIIVTVLVVGCGLLGLEYVIKDDFRVYFYATYDHTFVNFFGKKAEPNLLSGKAMRATAGNVEFMVGICF